MVGIEFTSKETDREEIISENSHIPETISCQGTQSEIESNTRTINELENVEESESEENAQSTKESNTGRENQRPLRDRKRPNWLDDYAADEEETSDEYLSNFCERGIDESRFMCQTEEKEWHNAIKSELRAHIKNCTREIKGKEKEINEVDFKMILKEKGDAALSYGDSYRDQV